jgi:translocation and assembly module TamB
VTAALLLAGTAGLFTWLLGTEAGARALLARLPGVRVIQPHGRLLGGESGAQRIEVDVRPGRTLVIERPSWRDANLHWQADAPWHVRVSLAQLSAQQVRIQDTGPPPANMPRVPPTSLALPLGLDIAEVRVGELLGAPLQDQAVRELRFGLHLGAGIGATHRVSDLAVQWNRLQASGSAQIAATAPLALTAQLRLQPQPNAAPAIAVPGPLDLPDEWAVMLDATGTLDRIGLQATLRARQQSLDATAQGQPFAAQPITQLQVQAKRLDIAPFVRDAPFTALTGELRLQLEPAEAGRPPGGSSKAAEPHRLVSVTASLRNERPTRWGEGGVPVRQMALKVQADAAALGHGSVPSLTLELGTAGQAAGRVTAQGTWARAAPGGALQIDGQAQLGDVMPAGLDARAPALQASGPVQWRLQWPGAGGTPVLQSLETRLSGRALALRNAPPLQLEVSASADASSFTLARLEARAGAAQASLSGSGTRLGPPPGQAAGTTRWQVASRLSLTAFDPSLWWPGGPDSAWRRGPHRLSGDLRLDLALPLRAGARPLDTLAATRGQAELNLRPSQVAGVPVSGSATLQAAGPGAANAPVNATLQLRSGASEVTLQARLDTRGAGAEDRWQVAWQTAALEAFAPLLRLARSPAPALSGDSTGTLAVQGRWPQVALRGEMRSQQLRAGDVSVQQSSARWTLDGGLDGTVDLQAKVERARFKTRAQALEAVSLRVQGTAAAHQAQLVGDLTGLVPASNAPAALAGRLPRRLHASLQAQGAWTPGDATRPASWSGSVQQAEVRDPAEGALVPVWLRLAAMPLQVTLAPASPLVQLGDTRIQLADATLHLERGRWQRTASGTAMVDLRVALEPLAMVPLLTRLQPDFGWGGDLRVAGLLEMKSDAAGHVDVDLDIARADGDLMVLDASGAQSPQSLGLSDARLGLHAHHGAWQLQQRLLGRSLGTLDGSLSVRTAPTAWWPDAQDALTGQINLRVATLGAWSLWLPAGWRLSGELATQARVGGRVGAPEFTGELTGRQMAVNNLVQGVDWHDAALRVALQGATARIESFTAQAGAGTLSGSGSVILAEVPQVQLKLTAQKFAALQRVDRRVVLSGTAELALEPSAVALSGQLRVDEGRIDISQGGAPGLDDDVSVRRGPEAPGRAANGAKREEERRLAVDLKVNLGPALRLRGRGLDTLLTGELHLTSPANRLAVHGTIRAADGTYAAYAQKLTIDRGLVIFAGTPDNPRLDIQATRPNTEEVRVGVAITGTAQAPRVRLFSEPEMSETDKLSWLVLGRPSDGLGRTDLALLQRAAYALLSGESSGPSVLDRVGLDELSVRQNDGTERETVVSLGKQLSRRWYVGYERSLNAVAGTWQLVYRAAQRFTLRAQSGAQNSLDLIWSWHWD